VKYFEGYVTVDINVSKFDKCKVLVVGDLMLDEYLWGEVDRISPEAPVQVVSVQKEDFTLGGSGNVANNLVSLGASVYAVGVAGTGLNGKLLLEKFKKLGINTKGVIRDSKRPTTRKTRVIAANQHVLRIDRETRSEISGPPLEKLNRYIEKIMPAVDVVLISDYGKGFVSKPFVSLIVRAAKKNKKMVIADPKGLDFSKYSGTFLLTPNKKEASLASGIEITDEKTLFEAGAKILKTSNVKYLLVTCGKDGMVLFSKNEKPFKISAQARQVYDVSGAGDTVLAVLGLTLASGFSLKESAALANTAAGIVVGKVGTATISKEEFKSATATGTDSFSGKFKKLSELPVLVRELRRQGKKIILTNGCFDLLHAGHIMFFSASKQLGDVLIVAIDDDASVRKLKGKGRPVIGERDRVKILCAVDAIDHVVMFSTNELNKLIEIIRPDVLSKGSNYTSKEVIGRKIVEKHKGQVILIPVTEDISSTDIIAHIKEKGAESKSS
jgi:D-beta-D-heptose 7-phosphate kinase/D-beta-D-heptose 1-phosphate adenosyltransferase